MSYHSMIVSILLFLLSVSPGSSEVRAVLVGVSDYEFVSGIPDLRGPKNDVVLMRDVLQKRGVSDITVLADGVKGAGWPTRQAILNALKGVSERAASGDTIYIHLSGHGTQQPDQHNDETDGLDEVFLPADAGKAPKGSSEIPNALTDDEIRQALRTIRMTGADVWFVMDSCHSGSGARAAPQFSAERSVDPEALGIDLSRSTSRASSAASAQPLETLPGMGRLIAFYATKANDVAREVQIDREGEKGRWYGLFTLALAAQLDGAQSPTYRQVFQSVLSRLGRGAGFGVAVMQTPIWEGDLIDAPVLGGSASEGVHRFLLDGDRLEAGLVHGFPVGTLLGLVADVTDPPDAIIGYAQVEVAETQQSFLRPVSRSCIPEDAQLCPKEGSLPEEARAAQLELHPKNRSIGFSPLINWDDGSEVDRADAVSALVAEALTAAGKDVGVSIDRGVDVYDVEIAMREGSLWFAPNTRLGSQPAGLEFRLGQDDERENLQAVLARILKAELFAKTMENLDQGNSFLNPAPIDVEVRYFASDLSDLSKPGQAANPRSECGKVASRYHPDKTTVLDDGRDLKQCDILDFVAKGTREGQRSVNRIYIDARYCIKNYYELVEGDRQSRKIGPPMQMCSDCPGAVAYSAGIERLYFLISEFEDNREALNLTGLVENCIGLRDANSRDRSAAVFELQETLEKFGERGTTRGELGGGFGISNVWTSSLRWRVLPRTEAFGRAGADQGAH